MFEIRVDLMDGGVKDFTFDTWATCEHFCTELRRGEYWQSEFIVGITAYVFCLLHGRQHCDAFGVCLHCLNDQVELEQQVQEELVDAREFDEYQQMKSDLRIQM